VKSATKRAKHSWLALGQGAFYVVTGLWPLFHLESFEAVSGRKKEKWLVKTMGVFIAAVGGALILGAKSRRPTVPLGVLSAAALAACDVVYAGKGQIAKTYLLDAAVESAIVLGWLGTSRRERGASSLTSS
jgi:hypothetical protein